MPLYQVTAAAGGRVNGLRVFVGSLVVMSEAEALYEVDLGHVVPTSAAELAQPVAGLTDAERAALPRLDPVEAAEPQFDFGTMRSSDGTGAEMVGVPLEPDGRGGLVGTLIEE
jgi:hypothetical protein